MKFSKKWLFEWINPLVNGVEICNQMTQAGLESEILINKSNQFKKIVVGKIIYCDIHPKSKKLKILQVKIEKEKNIQVISNAKNCKIGIKVAVAVKGSTIFKNKKVFSKVIMNELSEGILCSFQELGMFDNYTNNIIELPFNALIGEDVQKYFPLNDSIINISIPSNRADVLGIIGIAREVSVLNNLNFFQLKKNFLPVKIKSLGNIKILTCKESPKYIGRIIKNVNLSVDTPFWMKEKLRSSHIFLEKNIIFNIINYVLIELNQPLHICSWNSNNINLKVRFSKKNEIFKIKEKKSIILEKKIVVVTNKKSEIIFIPSGLNSKDNAISFNTSNVLLSSIFLTPEYAKTLSNHKYISHKILETYKRGIDFKLQTYAVEYATALVVQICGGFSGSIIKENVFSNYFKEKKVFLHLEKIKKILGYTINIIEIKKILINLGFELSEYKDNIWRVIIPTWRYDLFFEEDIISEIIRIKGCNKILSTPIKSKNIVNKKNELLFCLKDIKNMFLYKGYSEIISYSFINPLQQNYFIKNEKTINLLNPISIEMSSMRQTLFVGLLNTIAYNQNRQETSIRLFETGLCFKINENKEFEIKQELFISGAISGAITEKHWNIADRKLNYFDLKDDLESMFFLTGYHSSISFFPKIFPGLHCQQSAEILLNDISIGRIGTLNPILIKKFNLKDIVFLFEISIKNLFPFNFFSIKNISVYPSSNKDISFLISDKIFFNDVYKECQLISPKNIKKVSLIDIYTDKKFFKGMKSMTISLFFQNQFKTLMEDEILKLVEKCILRLKAKFNIILRNK
ncbi:phenylalanine--tRNA ligase subunit beta [Buchnera aphidicola]|uniref:phenylalanine--tRNA ligase subunit beta n=1 Tax=Buchnera aphidicola TaxID=9 RepID=UPI003464175F